jgi:hypothetical protein
MKKIICMAIAMLFCLQAIEAQTDTSEGNKNLQLWVLIANSFTGKAITDTISATLMTEDSAVVETAKSIMTGDGYSVVRFKVTNEKRKYIVKFESPDYASKTEDVKVAFGKRQTRFMYGPVKLRRLGMSEKMQMVGEVVVKSTKVKFYHKGDTLVYNSDAFNLAEGSMLDALIRQLPGAELKDDGRIYVNGKFVESLLLNGRDFFKGKNDVLLDNLPAYMVHQVKVYDKRSDLSKFMGKKMDEDIYVMDVNLKRQYSIGWIGNVEAGAASSFNSNDDNRYRARFFLSRFTPQSRISMYGSMNNLNENRKPGQNGEWSPQDLSGGLQTIKNGGLDYSVKEKHGRFDFSGSIDAGYLDLTKDSRNSITTFLPSGDNYEYRWNNNKTKDLEISTQHFIKFQFGKPSVDFLSFNPWFNYSRIKNQNSLLTGTFSQDLSSEDNLRDSLMTFDDGSFLRRLALNRRQQTSKSSFTKHEGGLYMRNYCKIPKTDDALVIDDKITYNHRSNETFDRQNIFYNSQPGNYMNRYRQQPHHEFTNNFSAKYYFWPGSDNFHIAPSYRMYYYHEYSSDNLYRLDMLSPEGDHESIGWLPSTQQSLLSTLDGGNSYEKWENSRDHWFSLEFSLQQPIGKGHFNATANMTAIRYDGDMKLSGTSNNVEKKTWLPRPVVHMEWLTPKRMHEITLFYEMMSWHPTLWNLLDKTFTSDPLNIWKGNPKLKNSYQNEVWLRYRADQWMSSKRRILNATLGWSVTSHSIASAIYYNRNSGVRTSYPTNMEGNWHSWFNTTFATPLDKGKKLMLNTKTNIDYWNSVDLVTLSGSITPDRSSVHNMYATENITLDADLGKHHAGLVGRITYSNVTSSRTGFNNIHAWELKYGANANISLPAKLQLTTDLSMYSRRGYNDKAMNTDELVWNARLIRPICHNRLVVSLDAFDILGKLSNISYSVNAQGRTETWVNSMPRYVMLSVMYRLNKQPKKK